MSLKERTNVANIGDEPCDTGAEALSKNKSFAEEQHDEALSGKENDNEEIPSGQPPTKKQKRDESTEEIDSESKLRDQAKEQARLLKVEEGLRKELEKELKKRQKDEEKRRKEAEKEQERKKKEEEKEQERKKKEEDRRKLQLKKEEEKKQKEREREEERRKKEQEREEEKKRKEAEREELKRQKLEEKKKKESEKLKNQPSLAKFFTITPKKTESLDNTQGATSPGSSSIGSPKVKTKVEPACSDYRAFFLPYHVRSDVRMAPPLNTCSSDDSGDMVGWIKSYRAERGAPPSITLNDIVSMTNQDALDICKNLKGIAYKLLYFAEDVRPPYFGTFSKYISDAGLNPFKRISDDINYDYDSETEWIRDEEDDGEDLGDDDSEDAMDSDDDDMEGFLDSDEETTKRQIIGPLVPAYKWNDGNDPETFSRLRVDVLLPVEGPIDPHFDYWKPPRVLEKEAKTSAEKPRQKTLIIGSSLSTAVDKSAASPSPKQVKLIPEDALSDLFVEMVGEFKSAPLLVELMKHKHPKFSKEAIRSTIKATAIQAGTKDKRWEVREEFKKYLQTAN